MKFKNILTYNLLKQEYFDKNRQIKEIAKDNNCSSYAVWYYIKKYKFPTKYERAKQKIN